MEHGYLSLSKKSIKETVFGLLTQWCTGLWHLLYMDNWYNSVELSEALLELQVHTCGTLRSNRGEPVKIRNPHYLDKHDVFSRNNGKVMVIAWENKTIVKAIMAKHDNSQVAAVHQNAEVQCQKCFKKFNRKDVMERH